MSSGGWSRREQHVADEAYMAFSAVVDTGAARIIWLPEFPTAPMLNRVDRNILRAGFAELAVTANWLGTS